jgi:hypothetical protein
MQALHQFNQSMSHRISPPLAQFAWGKWDDIRIQGVRTVLQDFVQQRAIHPHDQLTPPDVIFAIPVGRRQPLPRRLDAEEESMASESESDIREVSVHPPQAEERATSSRQMAPSAHEAPTQRLKPTILTAPELGVAAAAAGLKRLHTPTQATPSARDQTRTQAKAAPALTPIPKAIKKGEAERLTTEAERLSYFRGESPQPKRRRLATMGQAPLEMTWTPEQQRRYAVRWATAEGDLDQFRTALHRWGIPSYGRDPSGDGRVDLDVEGAAAMQELLRTVRVSYGQADRQMQQWGEACQAQRLIWENMGLVEWEQARKAIGSGKRSARKWLEEKYPHMLTETHLEGAATILRENLTTKTSICPCKICQDLYRRRRNRAWIPIDWERKFAELQAQRLPIPKRTEEELAYGLALLE